MKMNEIDTYIKCNLHNTIITRSGISDRFIHKKSGTLCNSKNFTLVRTTIMNRETTHAWAYRIAVGEEATVGAGNS